LNTVKDIRDPCKHENFLIWRVISTSKHGLCSLKLIDMHPEFKIVCFCWVSYIQVVPIRKHEDAHMTFNFLHPYQGSSVTQQWDSIVMQLHFISLIYMFRLY
jgi:hypothetical protein